MLRKISASGFLVLVLPCAVMRSESVPLMSVLGTSVLPGFLKADRMINHSVITLPLTLLPIREITQIILNALDNHYQLDMIYVSVTIVRVN